MSRKGNVLLLVLVGAAVVLVAVGGVLWWQKQQDIKNTPLAWKECIKIPGAMQEMMYPGRCVAPDGRSAIQPLSEEERKNLQPSDETANWKVYSSSRLGVYLRYPTDWQIAAESANNVAFSRPSTPEEDSVAGYPVGGSFMLLGVNNNFFNFQPESFCLGSDSRTVISTDVSISGIPGKKCVITYTKNDLPYSQIGKGTTTITLVYHGRNYLLSLYDNAYISVFGQVLSTFKFLEGGTSAG